MTSIASLIGPMRLSCIPASNSRFRPYPVNAGSAPVGRAVWAAANTRLGRCRTSPSFYRVWGRLRQEARGLRGQPRSANPRACLNRIGTLCKSNAESWSSVWTDLSVYPAALALHDYGLGALHPGRYEALLDWLTMDISTRGGGGQMAVPRCLGRRD